MRRAGHAVGRGVVDAMLVGVGTVEPSTGNQPQAVFDAGTPRSVLTLASPCCRADRISLSLVSVVRRAGLRSKKKH